MCASPGQEGAQHAAVRVVNRRFHTAVGLAWQPGWIADNQIVFSVFCKTIYFQYAPGNAFWHQGLQVFLGAGDGARCVVAGVDSGYAAPSQQDGENATAATEIQCVQTGWRQFGLQ